MHECEFSCGNYVKEDEKYCKRCRQEIRQDFSEWLHQQFTREEIEVINLEFDGEEIA